ncbi:hypothetical protein BDD12DRAFT_850981 [Trichophaea hybrida]|nr:hypothetical protein BDD12DRAFT_850981 [Trichophaea hybrida]
MLGFLTSLCITRMARFMDFACLLLSSCLLEYAESGTDTKVGGLEMMAVNSMQHSLVLLLGNKQNHSSQSSSTPLPSYILPHLRVTCVRHRLPIHPRILNAFVYAPVLCPHQLGVLLYCTSSSTSFSSIIFRPCPRFHLSSLNHLTPAPPTPFNAVEYTLCRILAHLSSIAHVSYHTMHS